MPQTDRSLRYRARNIDEKKFNCEICGYSAGSPADLSKHERTKKHESNSIMHARKHEEHMNIITRKFYCLLCDYAAPSDWAQKSHEMHAFHKRNLVLFEQGNFL